MKKIEYIKPITTVYNINLHDGILQSTSNLTGGGSGEEDDEGSACDMNNGTDAPMGNSNTNSIWSNEW